MLRSFITLRYEHWTRRQLDISEMSVVDLWWWWHPVCINYCILNCSEYVRTRCWVIYVQCDWMHQASPWQWLNRGARPCFPSVKFTEMTFLLISELGNEVCSIFWSNQQGSLERTWGISKFRSKMKIFSIFLRVHKAISIWGVFEIMWFFTNK